MMTLYLFHGQEACAKTIPVGGVYIALHEMMKRYVGNPNAEYDRAEVRNKRGQILLAYSIGGLDL